MTRLLVAALMALALITPAVSAETRPHLQLPPPQYDKPYRGKLRVVVRTWTEIARICGRDAWACTYGDINGVCTIYLPRADGRLVNHAGWVGLWRHEVAHCAGWPADHPGARNS